MSRHGRVIKKNAKTDFFDATLKTLKHISKVGSNRGAHHSAGETGFLASLLQSFRASTILTDWKCKCGFGSSVFC